MAKLFVVGGVLLAVATLSLAAPQTASISSAPSASGPPVIEPTIDWGKCPQLAPSEQQRKQKTEIIKACLDANPIDAKSEPLSPEAVEKHRIKLGECALNKEDWVSLVTRRAII